MQRFKDTFYGMFRSLTPGDFLKWSPGIILTKFILAWACEQGISYYDFGSGPNYFKSMWKPKELKLFSNYFPLSAAGCFHSALFITRYRGKRLVKNNPHIWSVVRIARDLFRLLRKRIGSL
ncbi:MAG: GNAT family N-acetyltransferase [Deltaproteobacteria bacterium]|nr:GNAT family N-acetyltransferase [Deltaproteobacteria bacterium]